MSHIRKIRIEDALALAEEKRESGDVSAYDIAAQFNAVQIGESPTFYFYQVNLPNVPGLPGEFVSDSYEDLPASSKDFIMESTFEAEEEIEGATVTVVKRDKNRNVPDGAVVLEADLAPHRFSGE